MNEISGKIIRLLKIYSLPVFAIFLAFGLYYVIFDIAHSVRVINDHREVENPLIASETLEADIQSNVPLALPEPEAPLPQEPHAPNLTEEIPAKEIPAGEHPNKEHPTKEIPAKENPSEEIPTQERPIKEAPIPEKSKPTEQASYPRFIVDTDTINVRATPSVTAEIVAKKTRSEVVLVSEIKNEWARIPEGWVYFPLLHSDFDTPVRFIVDTDTLNVRATPSVTAEIVAKKARSEVVLVSEIKNEWARIPEGWVYLWLLTYTTPSAR